MPDTDDKAPDDQPPTETSKESTAPTAESDPLSFFNPEFLPEQYRENWSKSIEAIRERMKADDTSKAELAKLQELVGTLEKDEDLMDFMGLDPNEYKEMRSSWKNRTVTGSGLKPGETAHPAPVAPPTTTTSSSSPMTADEVEEWRQERNVARARQDIANLVNRYPEASEMLKDAKIKEEMVRLTGEHRDQFGNTVAPMPLEAAFAVATRQAYAEMVVSGRAGKSKAPAKTEEPSKTKNASPRKFASTEEAVRAAFETHGVPDEE